MDVKKECLYTESHEWLLVEGDTALVGISDFAQHALGDLVFVELPEEGDEFGAGEAFGVVESVKAASDVYLPVDGKILEINEDAADDPGIINSDPYGSWLVRISLSDPEQAGDLMDAAAYRQHCLEEE